MSDDFANVDDPGPAKVITSAELEAMTDAELDVRVPPVTPGLGLGFDAETLVKK